MNFYQHFEKKIIILLTFACQGIITVSVEAKQMERPASVFTNNTVSVPDSGIYIKVIDNRITVSNAPANVMMEIYNIIGTKVMEITMNESSGEYEVLLPKGYYIIRIADAVRKIVIR